VIRRILSHLPDPRQEEILGLQGPVLQTFCTTLIVIWRGIPQDRLQWIPERKPRSRPTMKIRPALPLALLAISLSCPAEEPNPFVNQAPKMAPPAASGESFVAVAEQILVPADQLDAWLEKNPLTDDASGLRAVVQTWIHEGTARLDQTAVSTGTAGRSFSNHSMWEQIYATEYEPPEPGEWPVPTAFNARNLGYSVEGNADIEQGALMLRAKMDFCGMLPHHAWNELAEKTRQPDDVFIPRIRYIEIKRIAESPVSVDPFAASQDPFAERPKIPDASEYIRFVPGTTYLAGRADNEMPEPAVGNHPGGEAKPAATDPQRQVRLFFFRGAIMETPAQEKSELPQNHHVSAKLIRVNHKTFSDWMRKNDLTKLPSIAWAAAVAWKEMGEAEVTCDLTAANSVGSMNTIQNIVEVIYPTEWEPGEHIPGTDGKASQLEFSHASAFETRNAGTTLTTSIVTDPKGPLLKVGLERVVEGGKSVHHRILRDGEWKPDITFPIFTSNVWRSELRVKRGEWMFVGSGSDIDAKGRLDPNHSVLAFVKVE
jgi:hypothetical protein